MSSTLSDIRNQHFQKQIQENRDDIDHVTTRVTEIEASIEFYDKERVDIKDHIKRIEQRQKDKIKRVQHITDKQSEKATICECSKGLDQLELTARKKNIIIAGVTEHKDERLKHLTLEILSNTNLPTGLNDIEHYIPKIANKKPDLQEIITGAVLDINKHILRLNQKRGARMPHLASPVHTWKHNRYYHHLELLAVDRIHFSDKLKEIWAEKANLCMCLVQTPFWRYWQL